MCGEISGCAKLVDFERTGDGGEIGMGWVECEHHLVIAHHFDGMDSRRQ